MRFVGVLIGVKIAQSISNSFLSFTIYWFSRNSFPFSLQAASRMAFLFILPLSLPCPQSPAPLTQTTARTFHPAPASGLPQLPSPLARQLEVSEPRSHVLEHSLCFLLRRKHQAMTMPQSQPLICSPLLMSLASSAAGLPILHTSQGLYRFFFPSLPRLGYSVDTLKVTPLSFYWLLHRCHFLW